MLFKDAVSEIRRLGIGETKEIYRAKDGSSVYVVRPERPGRGLKRDYKRELNFQIFLKKPSGLDFRPNHLRILIDFHLKVLSNPAASRSVLEALERVYRGEDPKVVAEALRELHFPTEIDPLDVNLYLAQLFMAEQAINWGGGAGRTSQFEPPYLFFMGYVRMVFDKAKEIDQICWSAAQRGHTPIVKYTCKDNKKHKKYEENKPLLWYLESE